MDNTLLTKAMKVWMAETMYSAKKGKTSLSHLKKAKDGVTKNKKNLDKVQKDSITED